MPPAFPTFCFPLVMQVAGNPQFPFLQVTISSIRDTSRSRAHGKIIEKVFNSSYNTSKGSSASVPRTEWRSRQNLFSAWALLKVQSREGRPSPGLQLVFLLLPPQSGHDHPAVFFRSPCNLARCTGYGKIDGR